MYKSIRIGTSKRPVTVVGVTAEAKTLPTELAAIDKACRGELAAAVKRPGFKGDLGEVAAAGDSCLLVGLGKRDKLSAASLRTLGGRLVRVLDRREVTAARIALNLTISARTVEHDTAAQALAEGIGLANWSVLDFAGKASTAQQPKPSLTIVPTSARDSTAMQRGLTLAECTNYARRLAATPPNICNPRWIANEAKKLARQSKLKCTVIDYGRAQQLNMGGLVNVGKGSNVKPCLIILEHKPARARSRSTLALIGKTITFDTGGYSLKISGSMKGMKYDKCGGMAVLGAMRAIAAMKLPVHVIAFLPAAENMVSGDACRPDDIITMHNGVTVEITNTDAEGRLVLGDALAYACAKYAPSAVIDAATLTGGVVVGLGHFCAGYFATDDKLAHRIERAAEESGEKVWRLPLWEEHRDFMRAKHADIWNSAPSRNAHPIQGAAFLSYFVDRDIPWAHIDIAGMADVESDRDLFVTGPTGYGVRLLTSVAEQYT